MNTLTIEELDREEIEFLPPRVVMTTCNPCCRPCPPPPCHTSVDVCIRVRLCIAL